MGWGMRWGARWIWAGPPAAGALFVHEAVPPKDLWNRFCYLRTRLDVAQVPAVVPCRVTADSRFVLYVNGHEVGRGPARSTPERLAYESIDLAPYLVAGENVVAALVRYYGRPVAWWRPVAPNFELGRGSFICEAPEIGLRTDATWRGRSAPYRQEEPVIRHGPPTEVLDGRDAPAGWNDVGFDDSSWPAAHEIAAGIITRDPAAVPSEPFASMTASDIAPLSALPVTLQPIGERNVAPSDDPDPLLAYRADRRAAAGAAPPADSTDRAQLFDAGRLTLGTPWIEVSGEAGAVVDLYVGEDVLDGNRIEIAPRFYALRYTLGGRGPERVEAFDAVGFRFVEAVTRGNAEVRAIGAIERRCPRPVGALFECSDARLTEIWNVGVRTLELCSTDAFLDCPGREQRAWVGDSYVHSLLTFVSSTDWRLVRRHLQLCSESRRGDGLLHMAVGGDVDMLSFTAPDYSLHWIRAAARYLEHTGDRDTVRGWLPTAAGIVAAFERYRDGDDGLLHAVPGWVFIDWAMTDRGDVTAALDGLYAAALDDYARLLELLTGDEAEVDRVRRLRDRTRIALDALWDDERGVYVDALHDAGLSQRVSQQTNAAAILGGCAAPDRVDRILDYVLDPSRLVLTPHGGQVARQHSLRAQWLDPADFVDFDAGKHVVVAQPFFSHFLHQAVAAAGRRQLMPELCLRWWDQLERGNTTFEEYWDAPPGTSSRCHAWSATPVYDLTTHVLGVRPLEAGYTRAAVEPMLGPLRWARGAVPTPHGLVEVDASPEATIVTVPPGITAVIGTVEVGAGTHEIRR